MSASGGHRVLTVWEGVHRFGSISRRLGVHVLTESTKRLRDPLAFGLLAAAALYLIAMLALLFKDEFGFDFADRAFYLQNAFTDPVWVLVILAAVALVSMGGERTPLARTVTLVALALLALMLVLGIVTWLVGYGGEDYELTGKITGTLLSIARLLLLAVAAFLTFHLFRSMPAPTRQRQSQQHQQWGPHGGQGGQGGPQYGQHGQVHGGGGAGAGGPAGGAAWGPPQGAYAGPAGQHGQPGQHGGYGPGGEQAPWGQQPQQPQHSPQQSPQQEQAAWGRPVGEPTQEPAAWGQPPAQQSGWADPDATVVHSDPQLGADAPAAEPAADPDQQAQEDDQRPGWWAPGS